MPRPPRTDYPGARHHVMNRGARHEPVFSDDASCALFLGALADLPPKFGVVVHGYALMPNHFHLLLEVPRGNLSRAMQHLVSQYTRKWNRPHGWDGPLFRGRYRSRLVLDDAHWTHLLAYIHLNPVRAHLAKTPDRARWTSHRAYVGSESCPGWLTCSDLLERFGSVSAYQAYLRDLRTGERSAPADFDEESLWARGPVPPPVPEAPEVPAGTVPADRALAEVAEVVGVPPGALAERRMGRGGNRPRALAAWWLQRRSGLTVVEAGRTLGMAASTASIAIKRLVAAAGHDARVGAWMDRLESHRE
ncbi:transposase [Myxococcota bacterium]|nr:transposase [Myxococcota bacterium]